MSEEDEASPSDRPGLRRTARLEAFSDGVFAIAITLLVLDLAIRITRNSEQYLLRAIGHEWPAYLGYIVSFATIGALWLGTTPSPTTSTALIQRCCGSTC